MKKKFFKQILTVILLMSITFSYGYAAKISIWNEVNKAAKLEADGDLESALPIWLNIIDYFEKGNDIDSYTNAAIFHKKVGKYYDSIKNYDKAVYHYEKENEYWLKIGKNWGAEDMIRADQIRTSIEYYTKITPQKKYNLAKYEPENGFYIGIYCENDKEIGQNLFKTKEIYGPHQMFLFYQEWGQRFDYDFEFDVPLDTKMAKRAKAENAALQVALNSSEFGLDIIEENEWIIDWAKEAKKMGMPIFLRFLGEMNGDWVSWNGDPKKYIEKFRMVHDIMEKYAPNVVMVWCPNDVPIETNGVKIDDYYPGDEYVDWVGVNFYVDYYNSGRTDLPNNRLQNPLDHLNYIYEKYSDRKPIIICETGVSHYSIPNGEDLTDWAVANLEKLYTLLPIKYPRVKAITYFSLNQANPNYHVGNRWNNYAISENNEVMKTYKKLIKSDSIVTQIGGDCGFTFEKIQNEQDFKKYNEIYFNIKIADYKISKVEFFVDDKLVAIDKELPFVLKQDLSNAQQLTIKVYDSKDNLYLVKDIEILPPIENGKEDIEKELEKGKEEESKEKEKLVNQGLSVNFKQKKGNVLKTDILTEINGVLIPSFNIDNNTAIIVNDLKYYGYDVSYDDNTRTLTICRNVNKKILGKNVNIEKVKPEDIGKKIGEYVSTDIKVYIDGIQLPGLNIDGYMAVNVNELRKTGCKVYWNSEIRRVEITLP